MIAKNKSILPIEFTKKHEFCQRITKKALISTQDCKISSNLVQGIFFKLQSSLERQEKTANFDKKSQKNISFIKRSEKKNNKNADFV